MSERVTLVPIVVLVDSVALAKLRPVLDQLGAQFDTPIWQSTMDANGWTLDALAWSLIIRMAADLQPTFNPDLPPKEQP